MDYTKDDFQGPEPYELILSIPDPFQREMKLNEMAEYASSKGIKFFKRLFKLYCDSKKQQDKIYIDAVTCFTGQPVELDCGDWCADDFGVSRRTTFGDEMACCHPILPIERLVNIDTGIEKLRIAYSKGKKWRDIIVDKKTLASANSIVSLADVGIAVTSENSRAMVKYISEIENLNYDSIPERKSVGRLGHIPDEGFSPYVEGVVFDGDAQFRRIFHSIKEHGSLGTWTKTASECRRMSTTARIMLASSFASVLVEPLNALPFFVHLWGGESGTGKTVALMFGASVWGDPDLGKYIQTFNSTMVGQEKIASFLNSLPMLVDELQLAKDSRGKLHFNVYALAQGVGRTRGSKFGGVENTATWRNCILTTGESPLTTLGDGAGALNRVIDIECRDVVISEGMRISGLLRKHYGFAGKDFVGRLSDPKVIHDIEERYRIAFKQLSDSDTTEKQAMAASLIIVADELITQWYFQGEKALTIADMAEFLQTKAAVSAGDRGYRYMCDWVAQNRNKFDAETGDIYGVIGGEFDRDIVFINRKVFVEAAEMGGFSSTALLSYMRQNNLLNPRGKKNTRGKRIRGILCECVAMKLTIEHDDETSDDCEIL